MMQKDGNQKNMDPLKSLLIHFVNKKILI